MSLTQIYESLLVAAYFRGGSRDQRVWKSNSDQILTLSIFYTGDISEADCVSRFENRGYVQELHDDSASIEEHPWGKLTDDLDCHYTALINLLLEHPDLIEGGGDFKTPALPTYTSCRLTDAGFKLAETLVAQFPAKPDFPDWPDKRTLPAFG